MTKGPRILVAGIGNIFFGDDAFSVEVVRHLAGHQFPPDVQVVDFGIRGFDLAFALLDEPGATILVDAAARGEVPGTLYVIEPSFEPRPDAKIETSVEPHGMDPAHVFTMVRAMGGRPTRVILVGCEPATIVPDEDGHIGLSDAVQAAVPEAVRLIESLVTEILGKESDLVASDSGVCVG